MQQHIKVYFKLGLHAHYLATVLLDIQTSKVRIVSYYCFEFTDSMYVEFTKLFIWHQWYQ